MNPKDRENNLYKTGKRCEISKEEEILFEYLGNNIRPGSKVLDIGCGSGEITYKIKEKGFSITGVDFSEVGVKLARSKSLDCMVIDLDSGLPFDDGVFDVVWAGDIIEHLFDPIFVLKEVNRVLIPGGALLCTIPYDLKVTTRLRVLLGHSYQESVYRKFNQYKHHTFFSIPLLKYMLKESFLNLQEINYVINFPKTKKEFISKNRALIYFAKTLAVRARKE